jgi:hypothetical protein
MAARFETENEPATETESALIAPLKQLFAEAAAKAPTFQTYEECPARFHGEIDRFFARL